MAIHILPDEVISQIAAGEVVERPASVVKELVENAIDAGASVIRVALTGDGRRKLQVVDNGSGIRTSELPLAFARHATSKLNTAADIYAIQTLGFRGEALASIASVSQVTVTTRHADDTIGILCKFDAGRLTHQREIGAPQGTSMTVEHLFANTPARLKFLKSENTEKRLIAQVIARYAMAYPFIRFTLEQDGREVFRTHGSGQLLEVMVHALGIDHVRHLFEVDSTHLGVRVHGYTSTPSFNRSDRSRITLFVNGRHIQDTSLTYAVVQAYHTLLMTGRYPVAVLLITVAPDEVDVNVHPTKAEVRFRDADVIFAAVQRAVRKSVIEHADAPVMGINRYGNTADAVWTPEARPAQNALAMHLADPGQPAREQRHATWEEQAAAPDADDTVPDGPGAPRRRRTLPLLRVVGQVGASYIIAEGPAGMYLIDQHAAHERILYEQFMQHYAAQGTVSQSTLGGQSVLLPPAEARLLEEHLPVLEPLGFHIEPFGPNTYIIRAVPAVLADSDPTETLMHVLADLEQGNAPAQADIEAKIVMRVCKQAAVKAGQILSYEQMQGLIRQLERCDSPLSCPHGRPTMIHLSSDQLAREFGRLGS
jgi:DNA mismatch repair protein MutL